MTQVKLLLSIYVEGIPVSQGSMRNFRNKGTGKVVMVHTKGKELQKWRTKIHQMVKEEMPYPVEKKDGVMVLFGFYLPKGKSVKREFPITKPDLDKLARAVGDALTGAAYVDDSQIVESHCKKRYEDPEHKMGVSIEVYGVW